MFIKQCLEKVVVLYRNFVQRIFYMFDDKIVVKRPLISKFSQYLAVLPIIVRNLTLSYFKNTEYDDVKTQYRLTHV